MNIVNLPIDVIPLERDVLSLEEKNSFYELYVKGDNKVLSTLSRSIVKFETVFGKIKYKYAKGDKARILKGLLDVEEETSPFSNENEILAAIMLDRSIDLLTPMSTQVILIK